MVLVCGVGVGGSDGGLYKFLIFFFFLNSNEMERQSLLGTVVDRIDYTRTRL